MPYSAFYQEGGVNALTASLAFDDMLKMGSSECGCDGGTEHRRVKCRVNANPLSENEKSWMQQAGRSNRLIVSLMKNRYGTIQEQVNAIVFLASDDSSYMTGTVVPVGGGRSRLIDRYITFIYRIMSAWRQMNRLPCLKL